MTDDTRLRYDHQNKAIRRALASYKAEQGYTWGSLAGEMRARHGKPSRGDCLRRFVSGESLPRRDTIKAILAFLGDRRATTQTWQPAPERATRSTAPTDQETAGVGREREVGVPGPLREPYQPIGPAGIRALVDEVGRSLRLVQSLERKVEQAIGRLGLERTRAESARADMTAVPVRLFAPHLEDLDALCQLRGQNARQVVTEALEALEASLPDSDRQTLRQMRIVRRQQRATAAAGVGLYGATDSRTATAHGSNGGAIETAAETED